MTTATMNCVSSGYDQVASHKITIDMTDPHWDDRAN